MLLRPLILSLCLSVAVLPAAVIRIGDAGSEPDPARFDDRFPEMAEWAKAGVRGGIPYVQRVVGEIGPDDDLAAAVAAADVGPDRQGVLVLAAGEYALPEVLKMKGGLILRGADRDRTVLVSPLNEKVGPYGVAERHAIEMASHSGLEDLTVLNGPVRAIDESTYMGKYDNFGAPGSGLVRFGGKCSDAWIDRCALTHAGSNPISIGGDHITIRDALIDKAYNKGGKGHGYLELGGASHILFYSCTIKNIRHVSIMWKSAFVVIAHCELNVDINYHDGLPHSQLVEATTIKRRSGHHWSPICFGWEPWQDVGPGPRCFLWNNSFDGEGGGDDRVHVLRDTTPGYANMAQKKPMILDAGAPPAHGTLYAVTGRHLPYEMVARGRCMDNLAEAIDDEAVQQILFYSRLAQQLFPADSDEFARAGKALAAVEEDATAALADLGDDPDADEVAEFFVEWADTGAMAGARKLAATVAAAEWEKIAGGSRDPRPSTTRRYVEQWHGVAPIDDAMVWYDRFAAEAFARIEDDLDSLSRTGSFVERWPHAAVTERVREAWTANLRALLDRAIKEKDRLSRGQRRGLLKDFAGTPLEREARSALGGD